MRGKDFFSAAPLPVIIQILSPKSAFEAQLNGQRKSPVAYHGGEVSQTYAPPCRSTPEWYPTGIGNSEADIG